jgi:uncharacterized protein
MKGQDSLLKAAGSGHVSMLELLVQRGASVHSADSSCTTALMMAVMSGQKAAAEWLLQHGVDIHAVGSNGVTGLHVACLEYSVDDSAMIEGC